MYNDDNSLAHTGAGAVTVFGASVTLDWLLAVAIAVVVVGALTYRFATRARTQAQVSE